MSASLRPGQQLILYAHNTTQQLRRLMRNLTSTLQLVGAFEAYLPVRLTIADADLSRLIGEPAVFISDANVFDKTPPTVQFDLLLGNATVKQYIQEVFDRLASAGAFVSASPPFNDNIPILERSLNQLLSATNRVRSTPPSCLRSRSSCFRDGALRR